ncbi:MAG: type VI secretion system baseplate subunit TssF [Janthinobacterium lividum]
MTGDLLHYYNHELAALRELAARFAEAHPKSAARLRLGPDVADDPHVERLLEGVAFLSGRVHQRLDDEFPELTDALLDILYPGILSPLPSACIVQLAGQKDLTVPVTVPASTEIETNALRGRLCRFHTTHEVVLWPIKVESVRLTGLPVAAPACPEARNAAASIRIVLRTTNLAQNFASLTPDRLRFFLRGPAEQTVRLYALLCNHTLAVALADGPNDPLPTKLPRSSIVAAGFEPDEALYPSSARSFSGFRLLAEHFALPEKFLFVDILGLDARTAVHDKDRLEIFIYLDQHDSVLERRLNGDGMALGCVPMVNLFHRQCEPIPLDYQRTEYPLVASYRQPLDFEVWQVNQVREVMNDGSWRSWQNFYRHRPVQDGDDAVGGFYHIIRRPGVSVGSGAETLLAPFDPQLDVDRPANSVLSVDALCSNRDLPAELPFGGGQPGLRLSKGISAVQEVSCLTAPTPTLRPALRDGRAWRLISLLSLGHFSVGGDNEGAAVLQAVLRLFDLKQTIESRAAIASLLDVTSRPGTSRIPGARPGAFCQGLDVTLSFDVAAWANGSAFLLASVLDRFLALNGTVNTFVRTSVVIHGRPGVAARFPARAGWRPLA